jgi:hypothetical protein
MNVIENLDRTIETLKHYENLFKFLNDKHPEVIKEWKEEVL